MLGRGQHGQPTFLVRDMAADRLVDHSRADIGERDQLAATAPGTTMGVGDVIDFSIEAEFTGPALASPTGEAH